MGQMTQRDQSWANPKSKWRQCVRMSYATYVAIGFGLGALFAGFVAYEWHSTKRMMTVPGLPPPGLDPIDRIMITVFLALAAAAPIVAIVIAESHRRLAKRVVQHEGGICPWCAGTMRAVQHEGELVTCDRCAVSLPPGDVQQYWANHWLHPRSAAAWAESVRRKPIRVLRLFEPFRPPTQEDPRIRPGWIAVLIVACITMYAIFLILDNPIRGMLFGTLFSLMYISIWRYNIWYARRPTIEGRFCAICKYQLPPGSTPSGHCPECGADWSKPGGIYSGRVEAKPNFALKLLPGLLVIPAAIAFPLFSDFGPLGSWTVTTNMLIADVTTHERYGVGMRAWETLLGRELNDEQQERLARDLLERRDIINTLEREANAWFIREMEDNTLPPELVDAYKSGLLRLAVEAPEEVRVGNQVPIRVTNVVQFENITPFDRDLAIVFSGFANEDDDDAEPFARSEKITRESSFGSRRVLYGLWDSPYQKDHGPVAVFTADQPGTMTVRGRYWLLWLPRALVDSPIEWNDDGTPILPSAVQWFYEDEITATIAIRQ